MNNFFTVIDNNKSNINFRIRHHSASRVCSSLLLINPSILKLEEENQKTKTNTIYVKVMQLDRSNIKNEPRQVGKYEKLNFKNYLQLNMKLIHNL